jgi:hypothetical protein
MVLKDYIPTRGILRLKIFRSGKLIEDDGGNNLITYYARNTMARYLTGDAEGQELSHLITHVAIGTDGTPPQGDNTSITEPLVKAITGFTYPALGQVQFAWGLDETEGNGMVIYEFGLLTDDGTLFARRTRNAPINKDSDIRIEGFWKIIF